MKFQLLPFSLPSRLLHPLLTVFLPHSFSQKLQSENGHQNVGPSGLGVSWKLQLPYFIQGTCLISVSARNPWKTGSCILRATEAIWSMGQPNCLCCTKKIPFCVICAGMSWRAVYFCHCPCFERLFNENYYFGINFWINRWLNNFDRIHFLDTQYPAQKSVTREKLCPLLKQPRSFSNKLSLQKLVLSSCLIEIRLAKLGNLLLCNIVMTKRFGQLEKIHRGWHSQWLLGIIGINDL